MATPEDDQEEGHSLGMIKAPHGCLPCFFSTQHLKGATSFPVYCRYVHKASTHISLPEINRQVGDIKMNKTRKRKA